MPSKRRCRKLLNVPPFREANVSPKGVCPDDHPFSRIALFIDIENFSKNVLTFFHECT